MHTRFILQMTAMWHNMVDDDRRRIFQRLNVYAIVAQVGWPTAIATCTANSAAGELYLPQGVQVMRQPMDDNASPVSNSTSSRTKPIEQAQNLAISFDILLCYV